MTSEAIKFYQAVLQRLICNQSISSGVKISCDTLAKAAFRKKTPSGEDDDVLTPSSSNNKALHNQTTKDDLNS